MRLLLLGSYGNMGRKYNSFISNYLNFGTDWMDYDIGVHTNRPPYINYTHFIIATPPNTHADIITEIWCQNPEAQILCEKPVITKIEHLPMLQDRRLSAAMIERFSPMINDIQKEINYVTGCKFHRSGINKHNINSILDLMIHDIDLFFHMGFAIKDWKLDKIDYTFQSKDIDRLIINTTDGIEMKFFSDFNNEDNPCIIPIQHYDMKTNFMLGKAHNKQYFGNKLQRQIEFFLNGGRVDAYKAHEFILCQLLQMS